MKTIAQLDDKELRQAYVFACRKYNTAYKEKKEIVILDNLSLMVENDLKDLFYPERYPHKLHSYFLKEKTLFH